MPRTPNFLSPSISAVLMAAGAFNVLTEHLKTVTVQGCPYINTRATRALVSTYGANVTLFDIDKLQDFELTNAVGSAGLRNDVRAAVVKEIETFIAQRGLQVSIGEQVLAMGALAEPARLDGVPVAPIETPQAITEGPFVVIAPMIGGAGKQARTYCPTQDCAEGHAERLLVNREPGSRFFVAHVVSVVEVPIPKADRRPITTADFTPA